ncbi:MAG: TIGR03752 family integrating conjugative element protein, partial [Gammaproteobacteria bacterium]
GLSTLSDGGSLLRKDNAETATAKARNDGRTDPNVRSSVSPARRETGGAASSESESAESSESPGKQKQSEPYYTIPDLSVLARATALTSLYGRVYTDGNIVNPAPVKVIVGRTNLTANFHDLPSEIHGMIFGGYAVGDLTGACVEVTLTAATFIFEDGSIQSAYIGDEGTRPGNSAYREDSLGYLSDPWGNPCIPGEWITNAPEQISATMLLTAAEGYARALRQEEIDTSIYNDGNGGNIAVEELTGSASRYAGASGVAAGINATTEWLRERYGSILDAYYVPAGTAVSVHIEQELRLDKAPDARHIRYKQRGVHNAHLD